MQCLQAPKILQKEEVFRKLVKISVYHMPPQQKNPKNKQNQPNKKTPNRNNNRKPNQPVGHQKEAAQT